PGDSGVEIGSDRAYPYCARYHPFKSPSDGTCEFLLEYLPGEGRFAFFARDDEHDVVLPSTVVEIDHEGARLISLTLDVKRGDRFSLFLASDLPDGSKSRCVVRTLVGSVPLETLRRDPLPIRHTSAGRALGAAAEVLWTPVVWLKDAARSMVLRRAHDLHQ